MGDEKVPVVTPVVTPGEETTEHAAAKSGSFWSILTIVLGAATMIGSAVLPSLGTNSKAGIIAGAVIGCVGIVTKCLVDLGYIKSRTEVKVSANEATSQGTKPY